MLRDSGAPLYEFFAGGGLARLGLEPDFGCVFANDIDPAKAAAYRAAFPGDEMREGDIWRLSAADLPCKAALAWARPGYLRRMAVQLDSRTDCPSAEISVLRSTSLRCCRTSI
jgi:hypothetical protein